MVWASILNTRPTCRPRQQVRGHHLHSSKDRLLQLIPGVRVSDKDCPFVREVLSLDVYRCRTSATVLLEAYHQWRGHEDWPRWSSFRDLRSCLLGASSLPLQLTVTTVRFGFTLCSKHRR